MELKECRKCGEVQRISYNKCIACGWEFFKGVEVEIRGESLKELYENWQWRDTFQFYMDDPKEYEASIEAFLRDYSLEPEIHEVQKEITELRKYLKRYNNNIVDISGRSDKIAEHLINITDDKIFVCLTQGVIRFMQIN